MRLLRILGARNLEEMILQVNRVLDAIERYSIPNITTVKPTASASDRGEFGAELLYIEPDQDRVRWYKRLVETDGLPTWREVQHNHPEFGSITVEGTGTVTNTTTETTLIFTNEGTLTLPQLLFVPGRSLRVRAKGIFSTNNPAVTLNLNVKLGSTTICTTGAQTPTAALSDRYWEIEADITCRVEGASGTVFGQGVFKYMAAATGSPTWWEMRNTATTTLNTTVTQPFNITATWGAGVAAADTISMTNLAVEVVN